MKKTGKTDLITFVKMIARLDQAKFDDGALDSLISKAKELVESEPTIYIETEDGLMADMGVSKALKGVKIVYFENGKVTIVDQGRVPPKSWGLDQIIED